MLRLESWRALAEERHRLAAGRMEARVVARQVVAGEAPRLVARAGERLRLWLVEQAYPLWAERGRTQSGLFAQALRVDGASDGGPYTVAGQGDMICAFAVAGRLDWDGPWERLIGETLELMLARREGGRFPHAVDAGGDVVDGAVVAGDQAAMARAMVMGGGALGRADMVAAGEALRVPAGPERGIGREADRAMTGFGRWQLFGGTADLWDILAGVAELEVATRGALPGLWQAEDAARGGDLWHWARVAAALRQ